MPNNIQIKVVVKGRVQGVFYRANTKREADRLGVKGYVRNLENGCVEAVFNGDQQIVNQMIEWCHTGPALASVEHVQTKTVETFSHFESFKIKY